MKRLLLIAILLSCIPFLFAGSTTVQPNGGSTAVSSGAGSAKVDTFNFVIDSDGNYVLDSEGNYVVGAD